MPAPKGQKIAPGISEAELAAEKERLAREKWLVVVSDNGDELRGAPSNLRSNQGFMLECLAMKDQALAAMKKPGSAGLPSASVAVDIMC